MEEKVVNILLVEDDEVDVMNVRRAFKRNRITNPLFVAGNGLEALAMLRGQVEDRPKMPDTRRIILLDINMPKMNGYELCKMLKSHPSTHHTPVIMLTGSQDALVRMKARAAGASDYITKPFTRANLLEAIAKHIRSRKLSLEKASV